MINIKAINLALRFVLELCALAALAYWGFTALDSTLGKIALGLGAPLLAAVIWGLFISPKRRFKLSWSNRFYLEWLFWVSALLALWAAGQTELAIVFLIVLVLNQVLMNVWRQSTP